MAGRGWHVDMKDFPERACGTAPYRVQKAGTVGQGDGSHARTADGSECAADRCRVCALPGAVVLAIRVRGNACRYERPAVGQYVALAQAPAWWAALGHKRPVDPSSEFWLQQAPPNGSIPTTRLECCSTRLGHLMPSVSVR